MCRWENSLKKLNVQTQIRPCRGDFFLKINNVQGKYQYKCRKINVQEDFFLKNNKRAGLNKAVQGGIFSQN